MLNCINECLEDEECKQYLIEVLKPEFINWIRERIETCLDPP